MSTQTLEWMKGGVRSCGRASTAYALPVADPRRMEYFGPHYHVASHWTMAIACQSGDYTMERIYEWFGVHYATVSRTVKAEGRLSNCKI